MIIGTANGLEKLDKCPVSTPYLISSGPDCHTRLVRCVKYFGIIVDDTLTWEEHIEYISVKIKRGIGIFKVTGKFLKRESLILIYRTLNHTSDTAVLCGVSVMRLRGTNCRLYKTKQLEQ